MGTNPGHLEIWFLFSELMIKVPTHNFGNFEKWQYPTKMAVLPAMVVGLQKLIPCLVLPQLHYSAISRGQIMEIMTERIFLTFLPVEK